MREFGSAVGTELVSVGDFALALGASGMKIAFAVGTEVKARRNGGGALRASVGQRFADEEINDQTDEEIGRREDENQQGPEAGVHVAALGVAVDISHGEDE